MFRTVWRWIWWADGGHDTGAVVVPPITEVALDFDHVRNSELDFIHVRNAELEFTHTRNAELDF